MTGHRHEQVRSFKEQVMALLLKDIKVKKERKLTPLEQLENGQSAVFYSYEEKGKWRH